MGKHPHHAQSVENREIVSIPLSRSRLASGVLTALLHESGSDLLNASMGRDDRRPLSFPASVKLQPPRFTPGRFAFLRVDCT